MPKHAIRKMSDDEVRARLSKVPGWTFVAGKLHREFAFKDFVGAFAFMTSVALIAEASNHHPDWTNVYNRVTVDLNTHDAKGVTERDFDLASRMNRLFEG